MIRHTVVFTLHAEPGSAKEQDFLRAARVLGDIPGVQHFEQLRQVGGKSDYTFGFAMEFQDSNAYAAYNDSPVHVDFVRTRWEPEVAAFSELDFVPLELSAH